MSDVNLARQARWRREWMIVTTALGLLAVLLGLSTWTWRLDQTFYDTGMSVWHKPIPSDVVVVAIDDDSLSVVGRWPWKRAVHAQALEILVRGQPKAVLLDLLLSEPDLDPMQDIVLAQALQKAQEKAIPVVLPVAFAGGPMGAGRELLPIPALSKQARLGHADAELDPDGVMRNVYLRAGWEQANRPHMALALLEAGQEAIHPDIISRLTPETAHLFRAQTWRRDQQLPITYLGPPGSVQHISYAALLRGDIAPSAFKDKYVLIGATAIGLGDSHLTPVSSGGARMSSVEIAAQTLQMLRSGQAVRVASPLAVGLGSASLVVALMAACWRLSPRRSLGLSAAMAIAIPVAALLGMGAGLWFPPSSFVLVCALVYPIWSWRRLEVTGDFVAGELTDLVKQSHGSVAAWVNPADSNAAVEEDTDYLERQFSAIKAVAQRLQDARHLMANTLAGLPSAVIVTDRWGSVQHANARALALIDPDTANDALPPQQSISQRLARLQPRQAPDWAWMADRVLLHGQTLSVEVDGEGGAHYLAGLAPLTASGGGIDGCVICLTDIADLKRAERQRDELLGFIAHDIRSPQASLISLAQLQRMNPPVMSASEAMAHVDQLARTTVNLCEELLHIMRAEEQALKQEAVDMVALLQAAVSETEPQAQTHGVVVQPQSTPVNACTLTGDHALIKRAVVNLLNNAIKFSPNHGTVTVGLQIIDQHAVLSIQDQGPGIPASDLARLFKRFERVESEGSLKTASGIGLGLVFIEAVATRHGGRVEVRSTPGVGSTFELWLPISA